MKYNTNYSVMKKTKNKKSQQRRHLRIFRPHLRGVATTFFLVATPPPPPHHRTVHNSLSFFTAAMFNYPTPTVPFDLHTQTLT